MSTVPDPQVVREIAREATQRAARRRDYIGSVLSEHAIMDEILASGDRSAYRRWCDAIKAEMQSAAVTVSWPKEQAQGERDTRPLIERLAPDDAERLAALIDERDSWRTEVLELRARVAKLEGERDAEPKPCVCGDPNCMPYWRPVHEQMNAMRVRADKAGADFTMALLEQICELRTELDELRAGREGDEAERDADVRAVAEAVDALDFVLENGYSADVVEGVRAALLSCFAGRIAELDARANGGAS